MPSRLRSFGVFARLSLGPQAQWWMLHSIANVVVLFPCLEACTWTLIWFTSTIQRALMLRWAWWPKSISFSAIFWNFSATNMSFWNACHRFLPGSMIFDASFAPYSTLAFFSNNVLLILQCLVNRGILHVISGSNFDGLTRKNGLHHGRAVKRYCKRRLGCRHCP